MIRIVDGEYSMCASLNQVPCDHDAIVCLHVAGFDWMVRIGTKSELFLVSNDIQNFSGFFSDIFKKEHML